MVKEKKGIRFELGMSMCLGVSCTAAGLRRGNFLALVTGHSIDNVILGMLCLVVRWCIHGTVWTSLGAVVSVIVVTGEAGPTL